MKVQIGGESIPVTYAINIWTDRRRAGVIMGVAVIAITALVGIYLIYPLKGYGLTHVGEWLVCSSVGLLLVELVVWVVWRQTAQPELKVNPDQFHSLARFETSRRAYDTMPFTSGRTPFVAYFVKDGSEKRFIVLKDNELLPDFHEALSQTHTYLPGRDC